MRPEDDPPCPEITSIKEAIILGTALARVLHYDPGWAERVYSSSPQFTHVLGPTALNNELKSLWYGGFTTLDERRCIVAEMVAIRLSQ